jgi:hypothetical protein
MTFFWGFITGIAATVIFTAIGFFVFIAKEIDR